MKVNIKSLQVFRGLAALAVVALHASLSTQAFVGELPSAVMFFLGKGYLGVDFFFVLSGFIIMYSHMNDVRDVQAVRKYVFKRLLRVFSPYLPITIGLIGLYALIPGFSASGGREYSLASSLLLIPADNRPALSVAWTLVHEMLFYGVFLTYFVSKKLFVAVLTLWALVILFGSQSVPPRGWMLYPLSVLNIEFMFGVLSAWTVILIARAGEGQRLITYSLIILGIAVAVGSFFQINGEPDKWMRLAFAFGLAMIISGFSILEQTIVLPWPAWTLMMGNASYAIYLVHDPLLAITQRFAGKVQFGWLSAMIFGVVMSMLVGYFYHRAVEQPLINYFRRKIESV